MMRFTFFKKNLFLMRLIALIAVLPVFAQQEQSQENVRAVNLELVLRVFKDGCPVGELKKNDFVLYEDGEKREIKGFFENHRRLAQTGASPNQLQPPRLYQLFFWVGNPAADVEGVVNRFFSSIYQEGDRVILSTPLKTFDLSSRQDITWITAVFMEQWRQEAMSRLSKKRRLASDLQRLLDVFIARAGRSVSASAFARQCSQLIQDFQLRELSPEPACLEALANSLTVSKNEKFALVFFQHDTLPVFANSKVREYCLANRVSEQIAAELEEVMLQVELQAKNFSGIGNLSAGLEALFIQADTAFHLLYLSPDRSDGQSDVGNAPGFIKNEAIFSNWDRFMREISKKTGGRILEGDRLVEALNQVSSVEDIDYRITYISRGHGAKQRKIDIQVDRPGMEIVYGRRLEIEDLPQVKITGMSADSQFIRVAIDDFYPIIKQGVPTGSLKVYVSGNPTGDGPPRLLISQGNEIAGTIEMPFAFPRLGAWDLQIKVVDQVTGKQDVKNATIEIVATINVQPPQSGPDPALAALLAKAAAYAEKLKKRAFSFFCREDVTEEVFGPSNPYRPALRNYWIYDYQIVGRDGKIKETRLLLEKNRKKEHLEKAQLETVYRSLYSFYMPVTILAREKQHLYHYRLLDKKKSKQKQLWHIAVVRRAPSLAIPWGEAWISEEDGSVWKINLEQTSILGYEKLYENLRKQGFVPEIKVMHEYNVEKDQVRFPGRTTFIERYKSALKEGLRIMSASGVKDVSGNFSFERSRTYFEYKNHRFFYVTASVQAKTE